MHLTMITQVNDAFVRVGKEVLSNSNLSRFFSFSCIYISKNIEKNIIIELPVAKT